MVSGVHFAGSGAIITMTGTIIKIAGGRHQVLFLAIAMTTGVITPATVATMLNGAATATVPTMCAPTRGFRTLANAAFATAHFKSIFGGLITWHFHLNKNLAPV